MEKGDEAPPRYSFMKKPAQASSVVLRDMEVLRRLKHDLLHAPNSRAMVELLKVFTALQQGQSMSKQPLRAIDLDLAGHVTSKEDVAADAAFDDVVLGDVGDLSRLERQFARLRANNQRDAIVPWWNPAAYGRGDIGDGSIVINYIVTMPRFQGQGLGRAVINILQQAMADNHDSARFLLAAECYLPTFFLVDSFHGWWAQPHENTTARGDRPLLNVQFHKGRVTILRQSNGFPPASQH